MDLYEAMLEKNKDLPPFVLHDGPPFSNGDIHMGHALNKTLKDFIVRSHAMMGYYTPYVPGWDNHGLPIETCHQSKRASSTTRPCPFPSSAPPARNSPRPIIQRQMAGFKRLGVVGNWKHPYRTMDKHFEAQEVKVFGRMFDKGYIYKGLKPVYWCPVCATAVAEAEIEYQDDPCTSVYVKFPMKDDLGKLGRLRPEPHLLRHLDDHHLDAARQPCHLPASPERPTFWSRPKTARPISWRKP